MKKGLMVIAVLVFSAGVGAEEKSKFEPSKESRTAMADAHKKMAECLDSERPISECRDEMRKSFTGKEEFGCGWGGMRRRGEGRKN